MTESEYYKVSKDNKCSMRCPILNYCARRAYTIYFYSDYSKEDYNNNVITTLQKDGVIPLDFNEHRISLQGEAPEWSKSADNSSLYFENMCPEVNLFDSGNWLPFSRGIASTSGMYDKEEKVKHRIYRTKHFSECQEYSYVNFNRILQKSTVGRKKAVRKNLPATIRFAVLERDKYHCKYCGRGVEDGVKLHVDHILAVSNGGSDSLSNLVTSCQDCNLGKSNNRY
ncbi:HNH endonuclease [Myroides sp. N17-2]|uniref:HNH endonuclease n=1 Tax=Myroides sp. N17-2 TaxID=2030799 RepID=UPI001C1FFE07|nr:HNH endonuclease [Myroides sp. N17-2]